MTRDTLRSDKKRTAIFTQTDVRVHELWGQLCLKKPRAASTLHYLVGMMKKGSDAVVISQTSLAKIMGCDRRTVMRAVHDLEQANYIQIVKLSSNSNAYVINNRVSWTDNRSKMRFATFDAQVIADKSEQSEKTLGAQALNRLPMITPPDEVLIPMGEGDRGSQPSLKGLEPAIETRHVL